MKRQYHDRDIINRGTGVYEVCCVQCGKWFTAQRYDASFCSSTCRSRFSRGRAMVDTRRKRAEAAIDDLIKHLPKQGHSKTFKTLDAIQRRIASALAEVETAED